MTDVVDELLDWLTDEELENLTDEELAAVLALLEDEYSVPELPGLQPHQAPPPEPWWAWLFAAGRGSGKTFADARYFYEHAMHGPPCLPGEPGGHRMAIVGPTLGDVASSCFGGPSGLRNIDPRVRMTTRMGGTYVVLPNGAEARCVGGNTVREADRLRAHGNTCCVWIEEAAAIPALGTVWNQVGLSCRAGPNPKVILSTTPVASLAYRRIEADPDVIVTHARTIDNVHGNKEWQARVYRRHKGTRTEKQELEGLVLQEVPGALWTADRVNEKRLNEGWLAGKVPPADGESRALWLRRALNLTAVYVGLDPGTSGRGDRTGLVVVGADNPHRRATWLPEPWLGLHQRRPDPRPWAFVLADRTALMVPSLVDFGEAKGDDQLAEGIRAWGDETVDAAVEWHANEIDVERNRLGRTGRAVIRAAAQARRRRVGRIHDVDADTSKFNRADPVAAEWLPRMWMVGECPGLEVEMTTWVPADGDDPDPSVEEGEEDEFSGSPDGVDALVHAATRALRLEKPSGKRGRTRSVTAAIEAGWNGTG